MKAAMNGVPNISIMDGWWMEGYLDGKTGWKFGQETHVDTEPLSEDPAALLYEEDSDSFYELFPQILKEFYDPTLRPRYIDKCINNLTLNIPIFNTHRVVAEYSHSYALDLPPQIEKKIEKFRQLYKSENDA
jgi:starch phosphorylase